MGDTVRSWSSPDGSGGGGDVHQNKGPWRCSEALDRTRSTFDIANRQARIRESETIYICMMRRDTDWPCTGVGRRGVHTACFCYSFLFLSTPKLHSGLSPKKAIISS
jgi:hypothetical protein